MSSDEFEVFACIVGTKSVPRHRMFHLSTDASPVHVVYPFWVVRSRDTHEVSLIDTGFSADIATRHQVADYVAPTELLARLGIELSNVGSVVVSHTHFDHFAGIENYPNAQFYVQRAEVEYLRAHYHDYAYARIADETALDALDNLSSEGRLNLVESIADVFPFRVHRVGGHTPGSQIIEMIDGGIPLVFAGDAVHLIENLETRTPTTLIHSYEEYQQAFEKVENLSYGGVWMPGHDPRMLERMIEVAEGIFRLDRGEHGGRDH